MGRILVGGAVAGIVVFVWGAISHMALPLGSTGIQSLPNEEVVLPALRQGIARPGLYFFPGMVEGDKSTTKRQREAAMKAWSDKMRQGPTGILVYRPGGQEPMSPRQMGGELLTNILAALVAAMLLSMAGAGLTSFAGRVFFVGLLGLFACLSIEASYWIWYGFPSDYTLAQFVDQVVGWTLGGGALAAIVKKT